MKKSLIVIPSSLFILSMYAGTPEIKAATEESTEIATSNPTDATLYEYPAGITIPATVITEATPVEAIAPMMPVAETPSAEATAPTTPITESSPAEATAPTIPVTETAPTEAIASTIPITESSPAEATAPTIPVTETAPTEAIASTTPINETLPAEAAAPATPIAETPIVEINDKTILTPESAIAMDVIVEPDAVTEIPAEELIDPVIIEDSLGSEAPFAAISAMALAAPVTTAYDFGESTGPSQLINSVQIDDKVIALTFDDGHADTNLSDILANLKYLGVKATFFMNGDADPALLKQIVDDGHQLANHSYSHGYSTSLSPDALANDINLMENYIQDSTGTSSVPFFRAPYGDLNASVLDTVGSLGYQYTIGWSIDTLDWTGISDVAVSNAVVTDIHPGAIVLMHASVGAANTPESLWYSIPELQNAGYSFATVSELLSMGGYYSAITEEEPVIVDPVIEEPIAEIPESTSPSQLLNQVDTDQKVVSLTISGVSDDARLDAILENLASLDIKATFFVEGSASQSALNKIVAAGHEIGNQAYSGVDVTGLTAQQLTSEVAITETAIENAGATIRPYFRAPGGSTNASVLASIGSLGYDYTVGWSIDPKDWSGISASEITSLVTSQLAPGAIILLDAGTAATGTAAALLTTIAQARALGYDFTTISGLLSWEGIYAGVAPTTEEPVVAVEEETGPSRYVTHVDTDQNVLALTFDDGDDYGNLYDVVSNLNSLGIKATFFLNGTTDPDLMKFIVDSGHQLANHTYSHNDDSTALSASALSTDINLMEDYILETTGVSSKPYFRAPAGVLDDSVLETVGSLGYRYTIGWTQDTRDWEGLSDVAIAASVTDNLDSGSIYLLHANPTAVGTPESLWYMVAEARSQGYDFVTIDQLMKLENGYDGTADVILPEPNGAASQFIEQVETDQKVISLTFDDLGDSEVLQQILDALAEMDVKATFFADASADPDMLYQIVAQGHEIGNHTVSHEFSTYWTIEEFTQELNAMDSIIQDATGVSSRPLFRPPYGDYDTSVLETAGSLGYDYTIGWSTDSLDWEGTHSSSEIAANVLDNLSPGAIYLMHAVPESANTPASLSEIISSARSLGYEFATVSDLLALQGSYTDTPSVEPPPVANLSQVVNQVDTSEKVVSLTISGVSDDARLDAILNNLASLAIKATFFVEGSASQAALNKIVAAGHEIGNQAYSGVDVTGLTAQQLTSEVAITETAIENAGATMRPYFRAPFGSIDASVLATVGNLGYDYTIGWSIDPQDWSGISASEITSLVTSQLAPGAIILLDAGTAATGTAASLLTTVAQAKALGYQFATISGLLALQGINPDPVNPTEPVNAAPSQTINQVNTDQKVVSLTISGVSDDAHIDAILNNLASLGVKATFFVAGSVSQTALNKIVAAGHEIGNQAYSGVDVTGLTAQQLTSEIAITEKAIEATGAAVKPYFRAPFGSADASVLATVGNLGYDYTIGWSIDPQDWSGISASEITSLVTSLLAPGAIILLDAGTAATGTAASLLTTVAQAKALGYQFATISNLLTYEGNYSEVPTVEPQADFVIPTFENFGSVNNPIITRNMATDVSAPLGTADPFIFYDGEIYHMFFEVLGEYDSVNKAFTDKVAHAYSTDLVNWTYTQVVLSEETNGTRAAYPSVFEYDNSYYMVPDLAGNVESFVATDFPLEWAYNSTLLEGSFVDTNIFEVGDTWYMTTSASPYNNISLYYNTSGDWRNDQWVLHPAGSIIKEDLTEKGYRGAGNPFVYEDYVVMPVQVTPVATNVYGEYTSWYKLSNLSATTATVEYLGQAVGAQHNGEWNDLAMHHISHAPYGDGYIYAVDGLAYYAAGTGAAEYTIGLFTDTNFA